MKELTSTSNVQSIERAFYVLELVAEKGSMSLKDLYTTVGINKASMSRIAATLCHNGYLNKNDKTGEFSLSFKAFEVGVQAVKNISYIDLIKSLLERLSEELDVIAQFSIEDHDKLLCIECFNKNNDHFAVYTSVGQKTPLYATSAGKAILSTYSNDEILEKWKRFDVQRYTEHTITSPDVFIREIAKIRQQKYATDREENELGCFCVGTVLMNYNRQAVGSISLSTSTMDEKKEYDLSQRLIEETSRLSYMLGYTTL